MASTTTLRGMNSLDANAVMAPGGVAQGLVDAIHQIVDGYVRLQDRNQERQIQGLQSQRALQMTLAEHGIDPETDDPMGSLASQGAAEHALRLAQGNAALDEAKQRTGAERIQQIRAGNIEPQTPVLFEGRAAAEGAASRAAAGRLSGAKAALDEAKAGLDTSKGLALLMGTSGKHGALRKPTSADIQEANNLAMKQALDEGSATWDSVNSKVVVTDHKRMNELTKAAAANLGIEIPQFGTWKSPQATKDKLAAADARTPPAPGTWSNMALQDALDFYGIGGGGGQPAPATPAAIPAAPAPATSAAITPQAAATAPAAGPQANPADVAFHAANLQNSPDPVGYLRQLSREQPNVYAALRAQINGN